MHDSQPDSLTPGGSWQDDEERARRVWSASARRAAVSAQHKRHMAAEIYWRSAFDIALANLQNAQTSRRSLFTPLHLLEPLQGLVNLLIEQGRWMAARSLFNEVAEFLSRKNLVVTGLAERLLEMIEHSVVQAQRDHAPGPSAVDNVEEIPAAIALNRTAQRLHSAV